MAHGVLIQFPGLGGYTPGILAQMVTDAPRLAAILADVDQVAAAYRIGSVSAPLTDPAGPAIEELAQTPTVLHLASFASAYVLYQALRDKGIDGDVLLGQSTGEITALAAGGALSVPDAARVLCEREIALEETGILGGLVAVRVGSARAQQLCGAAGGWSLQVSLSNSPEQSVISGTEPELPRLEAVARAAGVQATRLLVRYPHHNSALRPAAHRVAAATASYSIGDPLARVYSPILGRFVADAADARRIVDRHLTDPVDYLGAIRTLYDNFGVREFLEVGVRSVLAHSARETLPAGTTLLSAPPNAVDARQILDVLTGAATAQLPPRLPVQTISTHAAEPAASHPSPAVNGSAVQQPTPATNGTATLTLPHRTALLARLRTIFAEALGYPEDVFTDDAHLEADLGIASVKKTELLVRLLDEYHLPTPPAQVRLRDYTTLPKLAGLIEALAADGDAA
ncbi:acyltransferase domain-containing protein [Actinocrispum wychmicini]|uniref:Malonyl CoA-acyl carrier protein transacylase n=1 Tax=Actinocrispum wychmicini TaxID=1213861 RepID=A0A4R2ILM0_9PSEU|nr:acyltransferase domain-containing protein [Actinocrispum wychmicini]TCO45903.1 malonyl CoA-acyl carrier protein transacylase [Actinocrispum wychmicini]